MFVLAKEDLLICVHSWSNDLSFQKFKQCAHVDVSHSEIGGYLPKSSTSFIALLQIINDKKIQKRLLRCTEFKKLVQLKVFILFYLNMYRKKRISKTFASLLKQSWQF